MGKRWLAWVPILVVISAPWTSRAGDILNPKRYRSGTGAIEVLVEPSIREGYGSSTVTYVRAGETQWTKEFDFTIWDAEVAESGTIAGYAYQWGRNGRARIRDRKSEIWIVVIDEKGQVVARHARERRQPRGFISPPPDYAPVALGVTLLETEDRFIVRSTSEHEDPERVKWWIYRLSTGEPLMDVSPEQPSDDELAFHKEIGASVVPGTPLILVRWFLWQLREGDDIEHRSARISLLDAGGRQVWSKDIDGEYDGLGSHWDWYDDLVVAGVTQAAVVDRGFSFCSFNLGKRLRFACDERADGGWSVRELDAEACDAAATEASPKLEAIALEEVGTIHVGDDAPTPLFEHVFDYSIAPDGNLGLVHRRDDGPEILILRPDGAVWRNKPLPDMEWRPGMSLRPMDDGGWLLRGSVGAVPGKATSVGFIYEPEPDRFSPAPDEPHAPGSRKHALPQGGWVEVLDDRVLRVDDAGVTRWEHPVEWAARAVVTSRGEIAVLEHSRANRILFFDEQGGEPRVVEIQSLFGSRLQVGGMTFKPDVDGGVLLTGSLGDPSVVRLTAAGEVRASYEPHYADGRRFRMNSGVRLAPDGTVWTTDGDALLRLDDAGAVVQIIGEGPESEVLRDVGEIEVGPDGRIYCMNERTLAVHVFDRQGRQTGLLKPAPEDFVLEGGTASITVADDGTVYAMSNTSGPADYVVFNPDGKRVGKADALLDSIREQWLCKPGSDERWILATDHFARVDARTKVLQRVHRRVNGEWLGSIEAGAAGEDGSLAVLTNDVRGDGGGPATLNVYGPDGAPIRMFPLPATYWNAGVAMVGHHVVVRDKGSLLVYDLRGGDWPKRMLFLPEGQDVTEVYDVHAGPDNEVWLSELPARTIRRFRLPE